MPFDGNAINEWLWVGNLIQRAQESRIEDMATIACELGAHLQDVENFLHHYDELFWDISGVTHLTLQELFLDLTGVKTPAVEFQMERLKNLILGPGTKAEDMLDLLPPIQRFDQDRLFQHGFEIKDSVLEMMLRLICASSGILAFPVKTNSDQGIDALSIIPHRGRLYIAAIDAKPTPKGWKLEEQCTKDGVLDRILKYRRGEHPKLTKEFDVILGLVALCLRSRTDEDRSKIDWRLFGGFSWPSRVNTECLQFRLSRQWSSNSNNSQGLRGIKHPSPDLTLPINWRNGVIALRTLLINLIAIERTGCPSDGFGCIPCKSTDEMILHDFIKFHRFSQRLRTYFLTDFRSSPDSDY